MIGTPVRHSLSPTLYNAAFDALDLDWVFVALEVAAQHGSSAVEAMRPLGLAWLSVTMPHKADAAASCDELSPDARALGAANCVVNDSGSLEGHSTDGEGFLRALASELAYSPTDRPCVVLGAGGAARAVVQALARAGASEVVVVNRTPANAERAAALAGTAGRVGRPKDVEAADLVVNATSIGMGTDDALPLDPDSLHAGQTVVDLIYQPAVTALLAAAATRGATTANGLGMLVHQAALQFELVIGRTAPIEVMGRAARARLLDA